MWKRYGMTVTVLVPSSLVREAAKREATRKLGTVARAAVVFQVDRLTVYPDPAGERRHDDGFVETVLRYAATPPYLRKEVWDERDELEYVGVMPPLRVRSQTGSEPERSGSSKQGIVTEVGADGRVRVNCGLQHPVSLPVPPAMATPSEGERVTVSVSSREPVRAKLVDEPLPGYVVDTTDLDRALARENAGLTIASSRYGERLRPGRLEDLAASCRGASPNDQPSYTVAFGAPERGLPAVRGLDTEAVRSGTRGAFDRWVNTVPDQGSEVVRTEEAMFATLACLNMME
jgi:predicted SPOUT superfamily RNA methylase MTH1